MLGHLLAYLVEQRLAFCVVILKNLSVIKADTVVFPWQAVRLFFQLPRETIDFADLKKVTRSALF